MIPSLLQYVEETGSTNDDMMRAVMEGAPHGSSLYAGLQTKGRGRQGRPWTQKSGLNLSLSVAIVGEQYASILAMLPLVAGVAMAELVESLSGLSIQLKWPNDLYLDGKKLGGILCEGAQVGMQFKGAVIGVGVNVNSTREDFPAELQDSATSVLIEGGRTLDLAVLASKARSRILLEVELLAQGGRDSLIGRWQSRDVTRGRSVEILQTGQIGIAQGIHSDGSLGVLLEDGGIVRVRSGEVHLLRPQSI